MKYPRFEQIGIGQENPLSRKEIEIVFNFRINNLGSFRLVIPKKMLSETQTEIYAKTITGSDFSFRIMIKHMKYLEVLEINPSLAGVRPIWILRHVATSPYNNSC